MSYRQRFLIGIPIVAVIHYALGYVIDVMIEPGQRMSVLNEVGYSLIFAVVLVSVFALIDKNRERKNKKG